MEGYGFIDWASNDINGIQLIVFLVVTILISLVTISRRK